MNYKKIQLEMKVEKSFDYNSRKIGSTLDIVKVINEYEEINKASQEKIYLICLNQKNQIVAYQEVSRGAVEFANLDLKVIFQIALLCNASKFILVHNHPSGSIEASKYDLELNNKIKKASEVMNIKFLDHILIARDNYYSILN